MRPIKILKSAGVKNKFLGAAAMLDETFAKMAPVPMLLTCPSCHERHIDVGEWSSKPHHTHACQHCGMVWRPAVIDTVGVKFLPGFINEAKGGAA